MSLATRCTSCGTVFRVVQDQLKVSEGWVRCGRCDEVFNAIEGLFDLERDAPPDWKPPESSPEPLAAAVSAAFTQKQQTEPPNDDDEVFQLNDVDRVHSRFFHPEQEDVDQTPAQSVAERDRMDFADAQFNTQLMTDEPTPAKRKDKSKSKKNKDVPRIERSSVKMARAKLEAARRGPDFVQQAKSRERWRSPLMRAVLSLVTLALAGLLVGQGGYHFRDQLAAQWPGTRPALAAGCQWLRCEIRPPRRIDDVALESSALAPAGSAYRLSVVLRNRGPIALAMPWLDLSVTDASGQLISRRALSPAELQARTDAIGPGAESNLQVLLTSEKQRINGYTVEVFYP